jgi:transcriptional regulator with XRE-family HTH domain
MSSDVQEFTVIRSRILGALLQDARQSSGKTVADCAELLRVDEAAYQAFEAGAASPTLPQLEILAYYFNVPINHFWGNETRAVVRREEEIKASVPNILLLRQRIIGITLQSLRTEAKISIDELAEKTGLPANRIEAVERGAETLPLNELEALVRALHASLDDLVDSHGPVGTWLQLQGDFEAFSRLPAELREFIAKPINQIYLELAKNLSEMPATRLRTIAESILDITY